ncbi:Rossmann-like domain-containing protein [Sporomusa rhizae]|uniref:Rossmann-like domain-containing protein n=1 Tax=Sporomusa rhizae TaxID=357999 RepID=UPI00352A20E8
MMLTVQKRLIDFLLPHAKQVKINDVRIGLGFTAVKIESGHGGVAWTPNSPATSCTHFASAGTLVGRPAQEMLSMLGDEVSDLARALGLATANALLATLPAPRSLKEDIISSLNISQNDRVAMVGYFGPIIAQLRKTGCQLDILELNDNHAETLPPEKAGTVLSQCTIAIITGTSLINGTFDELISKLGKPRAAVLLGPSSPLCSAVFHDTKITHVAGSRVRNTDAILRIVSEGGGTMLMKPYLDFETVLTI